MSPWPQKAARVLLWARACAERCWKAVSDSGYQAALPWLVCPWEITDSLVRSKDVMLALLPPSLGLVSWDNVPASVFPPMVTLQLFNTRL